MPKVSIIVPVYNVEKYLERCVDSLLSQTLQDIEIILVDDCATDSSPKLCDDLAQTDSRIKVVHKPINEGLGMARNTGVANANGDYVMFLDSDDTYHPEACQRLYRACINNDAQISAGGFNKEISPGIWEKEHDSNPHLLIGDEIRDYTLDMIASAPNEFVERKHPVSVCLLCIRKSLIVDNELIFLSERKVASEDTLFKISVLLCCKKLVTLDFPFYNYYINGASLSHTFRMKMFEQLPELSERMLNLFDKNDKEAINRIYRFITSDARAHIIRLLGSSYPEKYNVLGQMLKSSIWDMPYSFPMAELPKSKRIYLSLCQHRQTFLVYLFSTILKNR